MGALQICETADTEDLTFNLYCNLTLCKSFWYHPYYFMKIFDYMVFCKDPTYTRYEFFNNFSQALQQYQHFLQEFGDLPNHDIGLCSITRIV